MFALSFILTQLYILLVRSCGNESRLEAEFGYRARRVGDARKRSVQAGGYEHTLCHQSGRALGCEGEDVADAGDQDGGAGQQAAPLRARPTPPPTHTSHTNHYIIRTLCI